MKMVGDETFKQLNVQNDADFDSDVNIDGNLVVIGTITGIFNGSANSIQDIDNTTSIDTDAIAETLTFSTNSIDRAPIDTSLTVNVDYNSTNGDVRSAAECAVTYSESGLGLSADRGGRR